MKEPKIDMAGNFLPVWRKASPFDMERPHHSTWQGLQPLELDVYEEIVSRFPKMWDAVPQIDMESLL